VPVPVRYFDEASSIDLKSSAVYALRSMATFADWYGHRLGLRSSHLFEGATQRP
jgi:hypothetical protein